MITFQVPETGNYITIVQKITPIISTRGRFVGWNISHKSLKLFNFSNVWGNAEILLLPGHWFEIANGYWPKKCHSGPHWPIISLKIERSAKDRKDYKKYIMDTVRESCRQKFNETQDNR